MLQRILWAFAFSLACLSSGCGPDIDNHNFGVGRDYSLTSFELTSLTDAKFTLNQRELNLLEGVWFKKEIEIGNEVDVTNAVNRKGARLKCEFTLNDGFTAKYDTSYARVDDAPYFVINFTSHFDAYSLLIEADGVLTEKRLAEFETLLKQEKNSSRIEGRAAG